MNLRPAVRFLRRRGLVIGAAALLGAGAAGGYAAAQQPLYQSTAKTFVSIAQASSLTDLPDERLTSRIVDSYADVATTPFLLNQVIQTLSLRETPAHLASRIVVARQPDQAVLRISASDPSPQAAAQLSNAVSQQLVRAATLLAPASSSTSSQVRLTEIQPATVASSPATPLVPSMVAQGLLAGLLLGLIVAVQVDRRRPGAGPAPVSA